jgi:peptidoglycan/LPS O-acetylase OafA/YrhL
MDAVSNPPTSPKPTPTAPNRLVGLDGLRGLALIAVILVHVIIILPKDRDVITLPMLILVQLGRHGLTVFFVLSGFLIFRPFVTAIIRDRSRPPLREYLRNRVLRIWPAYLVILTLATIVLPWGIVSQRGNCPPVDTGCTDQVIGRLTSPGEIIANLTLLQGWFPSTAFTGLGVSWSLVTEVGYYVIVPALGALGVLVARRTSRVTAALVPGFLLLLVGIVGRWSTHLAWIAAGNNDDIPFGPTWYAVINRSVVGQADTFGLGMIAAVVVVSASTLSDKGVRNLRRGAWGLLLVAPVVLIGFMLSGPTSGEAATEFMAVEAAALICLMLLPNRDKVSDGIVRAFDLALPTKLGEYSLSWYLWHYPVVLWFHAHGEWMHFTSLPTLALALVIVCAPISVLAYLTYNYVEQPAMRLKRRTDATPTA